MVRFNFILLLVLLTLSSCEKFKVKSAAKDIAKEYVKANADSIVAKNFGLAQFKVFRYTTGIMRNEKVFQEENSDTVIVTRRNALRGRNADGKIIKKELLWKFTLVKNSTSFRIVKYEVSFLRNLALYRQIINSVIVSVFIVIWFLSYTMQQGIFSPVVNLVIFIVAQLVISILFFGSILLALINTLMFLFLGLAIIAYFQARSAK